MILGKDGMQLLTDARRAGSRVPILMLTARDTVEDRVQGLEHGAVDYLVKRFAFAELRTRIPDQRRGSCGVIRRRMLAHAIANPCTANGTKKRGQADGPGNAYLCAASFDRVRDGGDS